MTDEVFDDLPDLVAVCRTCDKLADKTCACLTVSYCGSKCQLEDWERHKVACKIARAALDKPKTPPPPRRGRSGRTDKKRRLKARIDKLRGLLHTPVDAPETNPVFELVDTVIGVLQDTPVHTHENYVIHFAGLGGFAVLSTAITSKRLEGATGCRILECLNKLKSTGIFAITAMYDSGCTERLLGVLKAFTLSTPALAIIVHTLGYCIFKHKPTMEAAVKADIIKGLLRLLGDRDLTVLLATIGCVGLLSKSSPACRSMIRPSGILRAILDVFDGVWDAADITSQHMMITVLNDLRTEEGVTHDVVFGSKVYRKLVIWFAAAGPDDTTAEMVADVGGYISEVARCMGEVTDDQARYTTRPIMENLLRQLHPESDPVRAGLLIHMLSMLMMWNTLIAMACPLLRALIIERITPWLGRAEKFELFAAALVKAAADYPKKHKDDPTCRHHTLVSPVIPVTTLKKIEDADGVVRAFEALKAVVDARANAKQHGK